jgi:hypothetical protein
MNFIGKRKNPEGAAPGWGETSEIGLSLSSFIMDGTPVLRLQIQRFQLVLLFKLYLNTTIPFFTALKEDSCDLYF